MTETLSHILVLRIQTLGLRWKTQTHEQSLGKQTRTQDQTQEHGLSIHAGDYGLENELNR